jgi:hypothetical protein
MYHVLTSISSAEGIREIAVESKGTDGYRISMRSDIGTTVFVDYDDSSGEYGIAVYDKSVSGSATTVAEYFNRSKPKTDMKVWERKDHETLCKVVGVNIDGILHEKIREQTESALEVAIGKVSAAYIHGKTEELSDMEWFNNVYMLAEAVEIPTLEVILETPANEENRQILTETEWFQQVFCKAVGVRQLIERDEERAYSVEYPTQEGLRRQEALVLERKQRTGYAATQRERDAEAAKHEGKVTKAINLLPALRRRIKLTGDLPVKVYVTVEGLKKAYETAVLRKNAQEAMRGFLTLAADTTYEPQNPAEYTDEALFGKPQEKKQTSEPVNSEDDPSDPSEYSADVLFDPTRERVITPAMRCILGSRAA